MLDAASRSLALDRLHELVARGRALDVEFLITLAEFDRLREWADLGYPSLWDFCRRDLRLHSGATFRRTNAAKLIQLYPQAIEYLRDGRLAMTTLVELKDVLTKENADRLFEAASWKSKRDVAYIAACEKAPIPTPPAFIRRLPDAPPQPLVVSLHPSQTPQVEEPVSTGSTAAGAGPESAPMPAPPGTSRSVIDPLSKGQWLVRVVVSAAFMEKVNRATSILSHVHPSGDLAAILERGLDEIIRRHERRNGPKQPRGAAVDEKVPKEWQEHASKEETDTVPAEVRREVWARDGGRCVWKLANGELCGSTHQVEGDHIIPRAKGGKSTAENMRLLCRAHNLQHARNEFGDEAVDRHLRRSFSGETDERSCVMNPAETLSQDRAGP